MCDDFAEVVHHGFEFGEGFGSEILWFWTRSGLSTAPGVSPVSESELEAEEFGGRGIGQRIGEGQCAVRSHDVGSDGQPIGHWRNQVR